MGHQLAPSDLGGDDETSPHDSPTKEGDDSSAPELNHVPSTTSETSVYGDPDPGTASQNQKAKKPKNSSPKDG